MAESTSDHYPAELFRRQDDSDDRMFYAEPRLVVHIDEPAIEAIGRYFETALPQNAVLLDLMSSWRSHLPEGFPKKRLVGLGLNEIEMRENPQLDEWVVHDLNAEPTLPFEDERFDAAVVTVSIQYLTRPVEVFREVGRVLKAGAGFHVIFSNRMFPTKAVAVWHAVTGPEQRAHLIATYFDHAEGWVPTETLDVSPRAGFPTDPVFVVRSHKATENG